MTTVTNIAVLGSTGSIGQQTLDIVRNNADKFRVIGLACRTNIDLLNKQINEFKPELIYYPHKIITHKKIQLSSMEDIAGHHSIDLVVLATTGMAGLAPALAAIKAGKRIAIANKEVLVAAGKIIVAEAKRYRARLLPVDSEHSAIWQCIRGEKSNISRLILTASGGSFLRYSPVKLSKVTVKEALNHPTWQMGKKVTIDSATLMNKGLEVIEAHWLFSVPFKRIEIVIHPKSIVHSLVEFTDGSIKAQLSLPDMHLPIQYALSYPRRFRKERLSAFDLAKIASLDFEAVNYHQFPCLTLALEAGKKGGTYPAVLCAADEVAAEEFLGRRIKFTSISDIVSETLSMHQNNASPDLADIFGADDWARKTASKVARKRSLC
jgi:1-deoxy-D-xylulose-5-phosphate reductoisomerase